MTDWFQVAESLPIELQRSLLDIRDVDQRAEALAASIDDRVSRIVTHAAELDDAGPLSMGELTDDFAKALGMAEEKVQLAMRAYEMIDQHKKRLDAEIARYETTMMSKVDRDGLKASKRKNMAVGKVSKGDRKARNRSHGRRGGTSGDEVEREPGPDGKEPTYCLCNRVSFGLMTACDNPSCPVEWFHNICVGLKDPPKGKWYCPLCAKK